MTPIPTTDHAEVRPQQTGADVFVLGGDATGVAIARRLEADGHAVALVDHAHQRSDVPIRRADPTDVAALHRAGIDDASTVIVATGSDSRNLLAAQLVRTRFRPDRLLVLTNHPERVALHLDSGHESVCATSALADAVVAQL